MQLSQRNSGITKLHLHCVFLITDFDDTDFESGMGMWTNEYGDTLDWQRHQGYTKTSETGPNTDHTNGKKLSFLI